MAEPVSSQGQVATADPTRTTAAAPEAKQGQSAPQAQATPSGSGEAVESFFDPKSIEHSPELKAAYKQMQSKFTKEMQRIKESGKKVEAYDSFIANPMTAMQQLAQQYGYNLVQKNPTAPAEDDAPKTWADVYARAKEEVLKEMKPVLSEVRHLKQQNVEQYLDNNFADWRTYESEMLETLKTHPTLANDPDKLYRLSVPDEVWEARATKAAMQKLKASTDAGQISGANTAPKQATTEGPPKGASFNDVVNWAKDRLAKTGMRPLSG